MNDGVNNVQIFGRPISDFFGPPQIFFNKMQQKL